MAVSDLLRAKVGKVSWKGAFVEKGHMSCCRLRCLWLRLASGATRGLWLGLLADQAMEESACFHRFPGLLVESTCLGMYDVGVYQAANRSLWHIDLDS